jgi:hypothetical protein
MRRLLLPLLFIGSLTYGQYKTPKESYASLSLKTDVRNAILGSKPTNNKPSPDLTLAVNMVGNNLELSVGDELFNQIGFNRFFLNFGYHSQRYIPIGDKELNFTVIPYLGASTITRYGKEDRILPNGDFIYGNSSHLAVQGGISIRGKITDKILFDVSYEGLTRQDLLYMYPTDNPHFIVFSGSAGLHYIITD